MNTVQLRGPVCVRARAMGVQAAAGLVRDEARQTLYAPANYRGTL